MDNQKPIRQELREAIFRALAIAMLRWDEVEEDENCRQAVDVLGMLNESLDDDNEEDDEEEDE